MMFAARNMLEMMFNAVTNGSSMFYDRYIKTHVAYGVDWKFCRKQDTAKRILELLGYDSRGDKTESIDARSGEAIRSTD